METNSYFAFLCSLTFKKSVHTMQVTSPLSGDLFEPNKLRKGAKALGNDNEPFPFYFVGIT